MNRFRKTIVFAFMIAALIYCLGAATAAIAPEDVLASKGLTKFGNYYVLEPDLKLGDWLRVTRASENKLSEARKRHATLERDLADARALEAKLIAQNEAQTRVLDHISKSADGTYNYQVDIVNATRKKLRQCIQVVDDREKALQADPEPSDEEYVSLVVKLSNMMELVSKKYEVLAADKEVKSALDRLNESTRPPAKLGPSPRFIEQLPATRRLRAKVAAAIVPLDSIGGVPEVRVTLNDSLKADMVVEGGAPYVCITAAVAEKLGLQLGASDKIVRLPAGDGKTADAHIVVLKSVQVGDFTVENVPCAIQPTSIKTAKNVLGGSFLRHFIYRMDLPAGAFRISPIEGPAGGAVKASSAAADSSGELPAVPTAP